MQTTILLHIHSTEVRMRYKGHVNEKQKTTKAKSQSQKPKPKAKSQVKPKPKSQNPKAKAKSQKPNKWSWNGRFALQNAASLQIRDFSSTMQQIAREAAPDWKTKKKHIYIYIHPPILYGGLSGTIIELTRRISYHAWWPHGPAACSWDSWCPNGCGQDNHTA